MVLLPVLLILLCFDSASTKSEEISVWPHPQSVVVTDRTPVDVDRAVTFTKLGEDSPILDASLKRYRERFSKLWKPTFTTNSSFVISTINVKVLSKDTSFSFPANETYSIVVNGDMVTITAETVFGLMRGLETILQLVVNNDFEIPSRMTIADQPRYSYRGIMIDTARHYHPVEFLLHILDAMEAHKLNFLHIHFTDDQSFPVVSEKFPNLSKYGAYGPQYVYNHSALNNLVNEALYRGIHILPEFDMPAHSSSWGVGEKGITVRSHDGCSPKPFTHGDSLNPIYNGTYNVIDGFLEEMMGVFNGQFLHLGGDEVPVDCWTSNHTIVQYMKDHGIKSFNELESIFINRVADNVLSHDNTRIPIYWQEIFQNIAQGGHMPKSSIVEVWKSNIVEDVIKAQHKVILAYKWYLNHGCDNYGDGIWQNFYENDPEKWATSATPEEKALILGGETCMWSECVDAAIFDAIVWLRTAGAAEQLWSSKEFTKQGAGLDVAVRLTRHRCLMLRRGVQMAPTDDSGDPRELFVGNCV